MTTGTFKQGEEKVRPGSYFRFNSMALQTPKLSDTGVVVIPMVLNWGDAGESITISNRDNDGLFSKIGYKLADSILMPVREALKAAKEVIIYPILVGGKVATVTAAGLTLTANKVGTRGNDLKVITTANPLTIGTFDVEGFIGMTTIFKYVGISTIGQLINNDWIKFTGTANTALIASTMTLENGVSGTQDNASVTDFLMNVENFIFNSIAFPFTDPTLKIAFNAKIKYFREEIGKRIQGISIKNPADYEGIISVENGVVLGDGSILTEAEALYWVAGASAAAGSNGDLTYMAYPDAIEASPILKHAEIVAGLNAGKFMFSTTDGKVRVEEDVNTLLTLAPNKDEAYRDNRVIRTFDDFMTSCSRILIPNKYENDDDGMDLAKKDIVNLLVTMQNASILKNVDVDKDVVIDRVASTGKSLYATVALQPVRTYKKYYITVNNR